MIPYKVAQRTPEWQRLRSTHFTASEADAYCLEPVAVDLTVAAACEILTSLGIPHKKNDRRDAILSLLPDLEPYRKLTTAAEKSILRKIQAEKVQRFRDLPADERTEYESMMIELQDEIEAAAEKKMGWNIAVRRGNQLEPEARFFYEEKTGFKVSQEFGFIGHDAGGFGCSPDGLIFESPFSSVLDRGLEIKCPMPETHMLYLLHGGLPDDYFYQVHFQMACCGVDKWDFLSYCPGEAPLLITVPRDETTDRLERGLKELVRQKAIIERRMAEIWNKQMGGAA